LERTVENISTLDRGVRTCQRSDQFFSQSAVELDSNQPAGAFGQFIRQHPLSGSDLQYCLSIGLKCVHDPMSHGGIVKEVLS
jgi:hypothetical protein